MYQMFDWWRVSFVQNGKDMAICYKFTRKPVNIEKLWNNVSHPKGEELGQPEWNLRPQIRNVL